MNDPIVIAAVISLIAAEAAAVIGLLRQNNGGGNRIDRMLEILAENTKGVQDAAKNLNGLHQDMIEALREGRESHSQQVQSLALLLDRIRREN